MQDQVIAEGVIMGGASTRLRSCIIGTVMVEETGAREWLAWSLCSAQFYESKAVWVTGCFAKVMTATQERCP